VTAAVKALLTNPDVRRIFDVFDGEGEETRIAGGAVRDVLLNRAPAEIDFATTALPDEIVRRAAAAGLKSAPTGIEHGTVTIIIEGRPFEITTLRRDVETYGRHAKVAFGRDWAQDALRRDLTINGLFLDGAGRVHDFVGGEADLAARRVRFIGDARTRIREDFLRILRFFRFTSGYGEGAPDGEAMSAAIVERRGLDQLSRERIRAELLKFLVTPRAPEIAALMADAGFLGQVLGGVARPRRLTKLAAIEAALGRAPDAVLRLGALSLFLEENAERLREKLRLSNEESARLKAMAGSVVTPDLDDDARKAALYRLKPTAYHDGVMLSWAGSGAEPDDAAWRALLLLPENWRAPQFPVNGADLATHGIKPGPEMGALLRTLEEKWIAKGFPEGKEWLHRELGRN
jgi:poly(A) polymerase